MEEGLRPGARPADLPPLRRRRGIQGEWRRLWAGEASTIAGLVDEWGKLADEKRKESEGKNGSAGLADMLNELDGSHS